MLYVRNNKIKRVSNKIMEIGGGDEKKKKKVLILFFLTEKSKERKEERLKRFGHACN